jgi:hypothetical protein
LKFAVIYGPTFAHALLPYFVALAALVLAAYGVKVILDFHEEDLYIETRPDYSRRALRSALRMTDRLGLEVLDEYEHEPILRHDGCVRIYLAEKEPLRAFA